jgi:hypothetical protein
MWTVYGLYMAVYGTYALYIGLYGSTWTFYALYIDCMPPRGLYMYCVGSIWTVYGCIRLYMSCMGCIWTVYGYICVLYASIWIVYARGGPGGCPPRHDEGGISIVNLSLFEPMTKVPGRGYGLYMDCIWLYMGCMRCI